jgi:hypothetical protein
MFGRGQSKWCRGTNAVRSGHPWGYLKSGDLSICSPGKHLILCLGYCSDLPCFDCIVPHVQGWEDERERQRDGGDREAERAGQQGEREERDLQRDRDRERESHRG